MARKVLVIDDDADFVESITNLLEAKNYEVASAPNGQEGIEKAKADTPGIILLDVMMTKKDEGFDVARQLNADENLKSVPVIMISGVRKEMSLPFGFEPDPDWLPVADFLEKPVKPDMLLKTIADNIK